MNILINKKQISEIYIIQKRDALTCVEQPYRRVFTKGEHIYKGWKGFFNISAGIAQEDMCRKYFDVTETLLTYDNAKKDILENYNDDDIFYEDIDKKIYRKPYICIIMSNGNKYRQYFRNIEESNSFLEKNITNKFITFTQLIKIKN